MKTHILLCSAALLLLGCAPASHAAQAPAAASGAADLSVDEILARHIAALGGADAIEAIQNIHIRPEVTEPGFSVQGDYRATRDGVMRVDIYADGDRVFAEGIDFQGGWQQQGDGAEITEISEAGYAALARGIEFNLFGLHDLAGRGHSADIYGRETVDSVDYYIIHVTMVDGFERYFYISPANWLVERTREVSALHPDLDPEERAAETLHYNHQRHCDVLMATETRKIDLLNGEQTQHTQVQSIECNVDPSTLGIERHEKQSGA
jgi:hypothetical protein